MIYYVILSKPSPQHAVMENGRCGVGEPRHFPSRMLAEVFRHTLLIPQYWQVHTVHEAPEGILH